MDLSYWERKTWLSNIDFAIVGSGIVGLTCALQLREQFPTQKIVVFEKGRLPSGASTKNAGFACFGSLSEILHDLQSHTPEQVIALVQQRVDGLKRLRKLLGDANIGYHEYGGYELFTSEHAQRYEQCMDRMEEVNQLLHGIFQGDVFAASPNHFGFEGLHGDLLCNQFEGQLDTGAMMLSLLQKANDAEIIIINDATISQFTDTGSGVEFEINGDQSCRSQYLLVATNGFANQLLDQDVQPARAQVLITQPIPDLRIKGTFHLDQGYYYFRNIDNRVLFGGGRNLDFETETTHQMGLTELVQQRLESLLETTILPDTTFDIDMRWSGIMGVGAQKSPVVQPISDRVFCGVRLGGMGVAIGSSIGSQLAQLAARSL